MRLRTEGTTPVWIAIHTGALTLSGVALSAPRYPKIGSLVLIVGLVMGFLLGASNTFFVAGPYNAFDSSPL